MPALVFMEEEGGPHYSEPKLLAYDLCEMNMKCGIKVVLPQGPLMLTTILLPCSGEAN